MSELGVIPTEGEVKPRVMTEKAVIDNVLATESRTILSFSVDIAGKRCIVQSISALEWTSGDAACSSTTPLETIIEGDDFDNLFIDFVATLLDTLVEKG